MRSRALEAWLLLPLSLGACAHEYGLKVEPVVFESRQAVLRWEPFPVKEELAKDDTGFLAKARNITYDLRVFRAKTALGMNGDIQKNFYRHYALHAPAEYGERIVDRRGIRQNRYVLQEPLRSGATYHWTVRPRFVVDGKTRIGQWSMVYGAAWPSAVLPVDLSVYPSFKVPRKASR